MIVGLFPQLTGPGGIQRSGCLTAFAMASFAAQHDEKYHFLGLNDSAGDDRSELAPCKSVSQAAGVPSHASYRRRAASPFGSPSSCWLCIQIWHRWSPR